MRLNILYINERKSDTQALIRSLALEKCHVHITELHSIDDALELVSQESVDLLIVDLPHEKIIQTAKELLNSTDFVNTPSIYQLEGDDESLSSQLHDLNVKYILYERLSSRMLASYIFVLIQKGRYKEQLSSVESYMKESTIICEKDEDGDFIFSHINQAFLDLEDISSHHVLGKKVKDSHLLFGVNNLIEDLEEVYATHAPIHMPNYFYLKANQREWCDVYIYSSNSDQIAIISSSLSEVKRAHDKSTQSNRYLQTILNAQHHIIYITDGIKLINTNQAFLDFFDCDTMHQFIKEHEKVCNIFEKATEPFYINTNEPLWHKKVSENSQERYKIRIKHGGNIKVFVPSVEIIIVDDKEQYVVILTDVTELESEKEKLRLLAMTDALTGIANRLKFNTTMDTFMAQSKRYYTPLSVIMLDIDHFKEVNDNYSHQTGDLVLQKLTANISTQLREADLFVRWGGEEFLIILPSTTKEHASLVAHKLKEMIEEIIFEEVEHITCSFGFTQMLEKENISELIARVDEALYLAKGAGRNCIKGL